MIPSIETPIFRFVLFAGLVLLIGTGLYARYLQPRAADNVLFKRLQWLGGFVLVVGSLLDVGFTAMRALGELTPYLYGAYLTRTWNGQWVMLRVVLTALLLWVALKPKPELELIPKIPVMVSDRVLHALLSGLVMLTLSMTSHVGARGEPLPIVGDWLHLAGMLAWTSAVFYTALYRFQTPREGVDVLERVSSIALFSVGLLSLTGVYAGLVRLWAPELLSVTQYGQTLVLKVALVAVTLALAGFNRWLWMPTLRRLPSRFPRFQRVLGLEAVLLTAILATTGALGTTAPPERGAGLKEVMRFSEVKNGYTLEGTANPTALGGVRLEFVIKDSSGKPVPDDVKITTALDMSSHGMSALPLNLTRLANGDLEANGFFGMTGDFDAMIAIPEASWRITLPSR